MSDYLAFVGQWTGLTSGAIGYVALPFALLAAFVWLLVGRRAAAAMLKWGVLVLVGYLVLFGCIATGIYVGKAHGLGFWGLPVGFALCWTLIAGPSYMCACVARLKRAGTGSQSAA